MCDHRVSLQTVQANPDINNIPSEYLQQRTLQKLQCEFGKIISDCRGGRIDVIPEFFKVHPHHFYYDSVSKFTVTEPVPVLAFSFKLFTFLLQNQNVA
jgi:hypothetical protein